MISICIVDDHPTILEGVKGIFSDLDEIQVVATYESPLEFLKTYETTALPDVVLMDLQMPEKTGDKVLQSILRKYPEAKVLAFSNFDSPFYVQRMMQCGSKGYLLKSSAKTEIIQAIKQVYEGNTYINQQIQKELEQFDKYKKRLSKTGLILTDREKQILQGVADGLTTKLIAEKLFLSYHTVENYRNNIMMKLGVSNSAELIKKAIMMNWVK